jgi:hypothetical protein
MYCNYPDNPFCGMITFLYCNTIFRNITLIPRDFPRLNYELRSLIVKVLYQLSNNFRYSCRGGGRRKVERNLVLGEVEKLRERRADL